MTFANNSNSGSLPLAGRRILITRAARQASELAERLSALGATTLLIPAIEIVPPTSYAALDAALGALDGFHLVAFTSANAVRVFAERAALLAPTPVPQRIAVVGSATASAVRSIGLRVDVLPPTFTAESLGHALLPEAAGREILLVLAEHAPDTLANVLTAGGARVTVAAAYRNRIPKTSLASVAAMFSGNSAAPDAVTFTSASTASNLKALLDEAGLDLPPTAIRASIGPITSQTMCALGWEPHVQASEPTLAALAAAVAAHLGPTL